MRLHYISALLFLTSCMSLVAMSTKKPVSLDNKITIPSDATLEKTKGMYNALLDQARELNKEIRKNLSSLFLSAKPSTSEPLEQDNALNLAKSLNTLRSVVSEKEIGHRLETLPELTQTDRIIFAHIFGQLLKRYIWKEFRGVELLEENKNKIAESLSHLTDEPIAQLIPNIDYFHTIKLDKSTLNMCLHCGDANVESRIKLIFELLHFAQNTIDASKPFVYTSFASFPLLQDYVTLWGIINLLGCSNITINLIDPIFFNTNSPEAKSIEHELNLFKNKIDILLKKQLNITTNAPQINQINLFSSGYKYIDSAKNNPSLKSTIITCVDLEDDLLPFRGKEIRGLNSAIFNRYMYHFYFFAPNINDVKTVRIYSNARDSLNEKIKSHFENAKDFNEALNNLEKEEKPDGDKIYLRRSTDLFLVFYEIYEQALTANSAAFILANNKTYVLPVGSGRPALSMEKPNFLEKAPYKRIQ